NSLSDKRDSALMIGDRFYDINGAHSAGLASMGVLWGFGDRTELEQSGADYICETVAEVKKLLLG
ncbi:MAG: HAD hydrolase-like protein, partial [Spirochaetales bacterium]|nr:HAD hydrolase-like protein [Spirochaetales bacterium]